MAPSTDRRVMYLLLRGDLSGGELNWPLGAIFTQIAHAATACIWTFREDPEVVEYMREMDSIHKVTLKVPDEKALLERAERLAQANVDHKVWIEDRMAVCIAVKPMLRSKLRPLLADLPLFK